MGASGDRGGFVIVTEVQNHVGQTKVDSEIFRAVIKALKIPERARKFEDDIGKEIDQIKQISIFRGK